MNPSLPMPMPMPIIKNNKLIINITTRWLQLKIEAVELSSEAVELSSTEIGIWEGISRKKFKHILAERLTACPYIYHAPTPVNVLATKEYKPNQHPLLDNIFVFLLLLNSNIHHLQHIYCFRIISATFFFDCMTVLRNSSFPLVVTALLKHPPRVLSSQTDGNHSRNSESP